VAQRNDQAAFLGEGDEAFGGQQPFLGMAPARERLAADQLPRHDIHARLVMELELTPVERLSQL
jgi:hypothetical protein